MEGNMVRQISLTFTDILISECEDNDLLIILCIIKYPRNIIFNTLTYSIRT